MRSKIRKLLTLVMALTIIMSIAAPFASASATSAWSALGVSNSKTIKRYLIGTKSVTTYTTKDLSKKSGSVDGVDEITVKSIGKNSSKKWYAYINYPLTKGGTKNAYIPLSAITKATTAGTLKVSGAKISPIYRRPGTKYDSKSYIAKGDDVYVLKTSGNYTQVAYPVSGGWKMGWVATSKAKENFVSRQNKGSWSNYAFGYQDTARKTKATIGTSGCGIMSIVNAAYALNGKIFIDPEALAKFGLDHGYRIDGVGVSEGLVKAFCNSSYGKTYNIKWIKNIAWAGTPAKTLAKAQSYIEKGNVAVLHVQGHYVALAAYKNGKYLVMDSYPASSRGTSPGGTRWMTPAQFTGKMAITHTDAAIQIFGLR